ncbi:MAG TPA: hypothetical protein VI298_10915 [Geobacteraceae bacterium]
MKLDVAVTKSFGAFTLEAAFAAEGDRLGIFGESGGGSRPW